MSHKLYDYLEVSRNASSDEIKRAYKKKAMQYHPDKNKDSHEAAEKFKEISSAYDILSDDEKRRKYDELGDDNFNNGNGGGGGQGINPDEIFERFFGNRGHGFSHHFNGFQGFHNHENNNKCNDIQKDYNITLDDIYFGINKNLKFTIKKYCKKCINKCNNCNGKGVVQQIINMGFITQMMTGNCDKCNGSGYTTKINKGCTECNGNGSYENEQHANLSIPKGFDENIKTLFEGLGEQSKFSNQKSGNLILELKLTEHDTFIKKGNDLIYKIVISLIDSIIGKNITIQYFDEEIKLNINQFGVINPTKNYIIKNKGLPIINSNGKKGNMIVQFVIEYPKKLKENADITVIKEVLENNYFI